MSSFDFHNKQFILLENSKEGTVRNDTIFEYEQVGAMVTADYHGGGIQYGKIIAKLVDDQLHMLYQCLTQEGELKAGQAIAQLSKTANGKIKMKLNWKWLGDAKGSGISEYIEK